MGRRLNALWTSWHIWTVLFFSGGIKALVNQVEGPFARSLVICDEPAQLDVYTGSRWCGSRLTVIQEGVEIQSKGQSQENLAMFMSLTFVIVLAGVWGAKAALVLGLLAVTTSVLLFVFACSSPKLGRSLYAVAQGLQGMYPIEYLSGVIMFHLSWQPGMDPHACFELGSYMGIVSNLVWNVGLGNLISVLELSDYTAVWDAILALNLVILAIAAFRFPAMLPPDADKAADLGPYDRLLRELSSYKALAMDWRARRMTFKLFFENLQYPYFGVAAPAQLMAYHSWSQSHLVWFDCIKSLASMPCIPIYQKLLLRYGHHRVYVWSCRWFEFAVLARAMSLPWTSSVFIVAEAVGVLLRGFEPFRGFVDSRFHEPEQMQRFQSCQWVMGYLQGIWVAPAYSYLFDAYAGTYLGRCWPGLACSVALVIHYFLVFHTIYDMDGVHGFGVTLRVLEQGGDKAVRLFQMIAREQGSIDKGRWELYSLETILGLPWEVTGHVESVNLDHWLGLISHLNSTPQQGQEALKKLDKGIAYAHGVSEHFVRTAAEQTEKVMKIWEIVAGEDGCISFDKWHLYHLEGALGMPWEATGGQGIHSKEHLLSFFDIWKSSREKLAKLDYTLAYIDGVNKHIARVREEEAALAAALAAQAHAQEHAWAGEQPWDEHAAWAEGQHGWSEQPPPEHPAAWAEWQPWEEHAHAPPAADASWEAAQHGDAAWSGSAADASHPAQHLEVEGAAADGGAAVDAYAEPVEAIAAPIDASAAPGAADMAPDAAAGSPGDVCAAPNDACKVPNDASAVPGVADAAPDAAAGAPVDVCAVLDVACKVPVPDDVAPDAAAAGAPDKVCAAPDAADAAAGGAGTRAVTSLPKPAVAAEDSAVVEAFAQAEAVAAGAAKPAPEGKKDA